MFLPSSVLPRLSHFVAGSRRPKPTYSGGEGTGRAEVGQNHLGRTLRRRDQISCCDRSGDLACSRARVMIGPMTEAEIVEAGELARKGRPRRTDGDRSLEGFCQRAARRGDCRSRARWCSWTRFIPFTRGGLSAGNARSPRRRLPNTDGAPKGRRPSAGATSPYFRMLAGRGIPERDGGSRPKAISSSRCLPNIARRCGHRFRGGHQPLRR